MANDIDIITIAEARTAVNVTSSANHDAQLATFITGITRRIDKLCGPVVARTVTNETHDGGVHRIFFRETPAYSVSTVTEYRHTTATTLTAESNASKPGDGYLLDNTGLYWFLRRRSGGADSRFPSGRKNVVVTYDAGRFADTDSVDEQFKLAVESIVRRVWKREQGSWAQSPDFFSRAEDPSTLDRFRGFFRAYDPIIQEELADQLLPPVGV